LSLKIISKKINNYNNQNQYKNNISDNNKIKQKQKQKVNKSNEFVIIKKNNHYIIKVEKNLKDILIKCGNYESHITSNFFDNFQSYNIYIFSYYDKFLFGTIN